MQEVNLLIKLISRQRLEHLSDRAFAEKIEVSRPHWQATRTGKVKIGKSVEDGVIRAFPDLMPDVMAYKQSKSNSKE
jgi:hypothetical protein